MDAQSRKQARARLAQMKQAAENLTQALDLPREATYDVLAMMYGENPSPLDMSERTVQSASSEESLKTSIFHLSEGFLREHMKELVGSLPGLWDKLKIYSLEILGGETNYGASSSAGLGVIGSNQIVPIISVISWWVVKGPFLRRTNAPDELKAIIARRAEERGCSRVLSRALAKYLVKQLTDL